MKKTNCPICGNQAEAGCIYGADRNALRWLAGDPSLVSNLKTGVGMGEIIGESPLLKGSYIRGLKCSNCNKIIADLL